MRTAGSPALHHAGRGSAGCISVYRGLVQSSPSALRAWTALADQLRESVRGSGVNSVNSIQQFRGADPRVSATTSLLRDYRGSSTAIYSRRADISGRRAPSALRHHAVVKGSAITDWGRT